LAIPPRLCFLSVGHTPRAPRACRGCEMKWIIATCKILSALPFVRGLGARGLDAAAAFASPRPFTTKHSFQGAAGEGGSRPRQTRDGPTPAQALCACLPCARFRADGDYSITAAAVKGCS
jgi:hypothetical protein